MRRSKGRPDPRASRANQGERPTAEIPVRYFFFLVLFDANIYIFSFVLSLYFIKDGLSVLKKVFIFICLLFCSSLKPFLLSLLTFFSYNNFCQYLHFFLLYYLSKMFSFNFVKSFLPTRLFSSSYTTDFF